MSDILRLKKMVFHGRHGLFPEERKLGQKYEVDVEIRADLGPRAVVDYTQVYDHVEAIVTGETYELVEALTDRIATSLVEHFHLPEVLVRVHKPAPPFRGHFDGIEVEVLRRGGQG
ncbi:MAG: dihydroneopterin aldolase [Candidatus Latescibacteria bacterium]|nr:dihydroneopterin aldolase [Candidatus Latescibacterota bacterium]